MGVSLSTTLHTSFDDAVARTRKALAAKGFGVLTEIDVKTTLKAKLGEDIEDFLILGACNPRFATRRSMSTGRLACCCHATWWYAEIRTHRTPLSSMPWIPG